VATLVLWPVTVYGLLVWPPTTSSPLQAGCKGEGKGGVAKIKDRLDVESTLCDKGPCIEGALGCEMKTRLRSPGAAEAVIETLESLQSGVDADAEEVSKREGRRKGRDPARHQGPPTERELLRSTRLRSYVSIDNALSHCTPWAERTGVECKGVVPCSLPASGDAAAKLCDMLAHLSSCCSGDLKDSTPAVIKQESIHSDSLKALLPERAGEDSNVAQGGTVINFEPGAFWAGSTYVASGAFQAGSAWDDYRGATVNQAAPTQGDQQPGSTGLSFYIALGAH